MDIEHNTQELLKAIRADVPEMLESEFVTRWLLTLHEYISGGDVEIGVWLNPNNLTVFSEVNIKDNSGAVLYTVPSIFMKQDKILPAEAASNISELMYRADNMNRVMPGRGNNLIRGELIEKIIPASEDMRNDYQRRWDDIFIRYDLEPVFSISGSSSSGLDADGDFDDYEQL